MCVNYLFFYRALKAQGIDRKTLPYYGRFQPHGTWIALIFMILVVTCYGYATFLPGELSVATFLSYYCMIFVAIATFSIWKLIKRSSFVPAKQADLLWERPLIDAYEEFAEGAYLGFWREMLQLVGFKKGRLAWKDWSPQMTVASLSTPAQDPVSKTA